MGATLSSHNLTDEHLRVLITEYTNLSLTLVEECWRIFVDVTHSKRFLSFDQFDEVFGMLVKDTEPHFQLFEQFVDGKSVANGYEALTGICLALRVDIKRKLHFIFRLYVSSDHENYIQSSLKVDIYHDLINSMTRMLRLSQPPSLDITSAMENALRATDDSKEYVTLKEAIEYSLTQPYVCAFFEELQSIFTGLVTRDKRVDLFQNELILDDDLELSSDSADDSEILWTTKILDVARSALAAEDIYEMTDDMQCFLALKELQLRKLPFGLVYKRHRKATSGERTYIGIVSYETFARCLLLVMPALDVNWKFSDCCGVNASKMSDTELAEMELEISDGRRFASMSLREMLQLTQESSELLDSPKKRLSLHLAYGDDAVFNLVDRFTTTDFYVPVAYSPKYTSPIVGALTPFDVVRFILEDLSLFNGKQFWPVSKLDCLFKPLKTRRSDVSMYESFHLLQTTHLSSVLLLNEKDEEYSTFGWQDILELVEAWPSKLAFVANVNISVALPPAITPTVSLPHFSNLVIPICHVLKVQTA
ncbi:hypothetical protein AeRB84_010156 [Aphanomyces euteiches]|nr:hypothetical protein AeRB84_010156 [Aphanomyces euteiches]